MNKEKKSIHWIDMAFMITIFFGSIFALFWFEYVGIQESKEPVDITLTYCSYIRGGNVCHSYVVRENKQELEALSSCSNIQPKNRSSLCNDIKSSTKILLTEQFFSGWGR